MNWKKVCINPFVPNASFFYHLKTSENVSIFWCFWGVEKGCIWNEWVKYCTCYYFDDIIKLEDFDLDNILRDGKSHENILTCDILYKTLIGQSLCKSNSIK